MVTVELTDAELTDVIQSIENLRELRVVGAELGHSGAEDHAERLLVLLSRLLHAKNDQAPANATEAIQAYYDRC